MNANATPVMPDDLTTRMIAMEVLKDYAIAKYGFKLPPVDSAEDLLELARSFDTTAVEEKHGWRMEPPFPGAHSEPQELTPGRWHMICACGLFIGPRLVATLFTSIVGGRPIGIHANSPSQQFAIPREYKLLR